MARRKLRIEPLQFQILSSQIGELQWSQTAVLTV